MWFGNIRRNRAKQGDCFVFGIEWTIFCSFIFYFWRCCENPILGEHSELDINLNAIWLFALHGSTDKYRKKPNIRTPRYYTLYLGQLNRKWCISNRVNSKNKRIDYTTRFGNRVGRATRVCRIFTPIRIVHSTVSLSVRCKQTRNKCERIWMFVCDMD